MADKGNDIYIYIIIQIQAIKTVKEIRSNKRGYLEIKPLEE